VGQRVAGAHDCGEALGDLAQRSVADVMAEGVVDDLEAIEVDEQHADRLIRAFADGECVAHTIDE
jgi:hypothetical protein